MAKFIELTADYEYPNGIERFATSKIYLRTDEISSVIKAYDNKKGGYCAFVHTKEFCDGSYESFAAKESYEEIIKMLEEVEAKTILGNRRCNRQQGEEDVPKGQLYLDDAEEITEFQRDAKTTKGKNTKEI